MAVFEHHVLEASAQPKPVTVVLLFQAIQRPPSLVFCSSASHEA